MSASRSRPALIVWLLAILAIALSGWVLLPFPRPPTGWEEIAWTIGFGVGFTTVGAILVDRRPHEQISRITLGIGLLVVAAVGLRASAVAMDTLPGPIPVAGAVAAVASQALQTVAFLGAGSFLLVRFPNGRERGRLSRTVDVLVLLISMAAAASVFTPGAIDAGWLYPTENPLGLTFLPPEVFGAIEGLAIAPYALSLVLAVVVIVGRYRHADAVTRAQIRWVGAAGILPVALAPLIFLFDWMWSVWLLSTAVLPVAIGIAILRYHLYDIDRIVGRTLAYAIVTGLLAAVFLGTNLLVQTTVTATTDDSPLVVAASTLLIAALFQPLRRRVQAPIDRRFNRAHLDAERVVGTFARRTRDEVDLGRLRDAVVSAVSESMSPSGAGLWLRPVSLGGTRAWIDRGDAVR